MKRHFLAILTVGLLAAGGVQADEKSSAKCSAEFDQCLKDCDTKYGQDTAKRAACVPQCSGSYAACDAGVAYEKAKPWFEEKAEKTKKFFEDLVDDLKREEKTPPPNPDGPKQI